jgi:hypothetical protein
MYIPVADPGIKTCGASQQKLWNQTIYYYSKIALDSSKPVGPGGPTGCTYVRHWYIHGAFIEKQCTAALTFSCKDTTLTFWPNVIWTSVCFVYR